MKFIVQKLDGVIYAYTESEAHFKHAQPDRTSPRLDISELANDCDLSARDDFHIVVDIKRPR